MHNLKHVKWQSEIGGLVSVVTEQPRQSHFLDSGQLCRCKLVGAREKESVTISEGFELVSHDAMSRRAEQRTSNGWKKVVFLEQV